MPVSTTAEEVTRQAFLAKTASRRLALLSSDEKKRLLLAIAAAIESAAADILFRNEIDVQAARESGVSPALIEMLVLTEPALKSMAQGVREIAAQSDPIGEVIESWTRPNGIRIEKTRVPLGVIAMIYESRPNVTVDAAALCLKSGNAVVLRG